MTTHHLVAEPDGVDVVVKHVPDNWVSHLRDFLDANLIHYIVGPQAIGMAEGPSGQMHIFRFRNAEASHVQGLMNRFLTTHHGQALRADLYT
jgi:hypothetical protein